MLAHGGEPARPYCRCLQPRADIDRIFRKPLITEAALDAVSRRIYGDYAGLGVGDYLLPERPGRLESEVTVEGGEMGQHRAIGPDEREKAAGLATDPGVEILEIFRQHGSLKHAGEAAVLVLPPPADAEERRALVGRPRFQRLTDKGADIALDMGAEIVPVREIDGGRRYHQAVDKRPAPGVEDPGRFHLRQRIGELFQPLMQALLARSDAGVGNAADDLGNLRQAAVD